MAEKEFAVLTCPHCGHRQEREIPAPITRKVVKKEVGEASEASPQQFEMSRDPLDVPAFMRRRAYADTDFRSR